MSSPQHAGVEPASLAERGGGWVMAQVVLGGAIVVCEVWGPSWPQPAAAPLRVVGAGVATLGIGLFLAGMLSLGRSLTPFPKPLPGASMREGGAYRLVRHPMYGGVAIAAAGWSLAATPIGVVATALLAVFLEMKSRREEAWLADRYEGYADYRRRVRRKFVPGFW